MPLITTTFVFNFAWNLSLLDEENTGEHFIGFYLIKRMQKYGYDNMLSRGGIIQTNRHKIQTETRMCYNSVVFNIYTIHTRPFI